MSLDFRLKRLLRGLDHPPALWCPVWMAPLTPREIGELFAEPVPAEAVFSEAIDAWDRCTQPDPVSRLMQFYVELYLQDDILTKVDRASMAHSLEVRAPFLDIEFVDHVRRLPTRWKFRRGRTKWLLRQALAPHLPAAVIERPKKGFGMPIGRWLREGALAFPSGLPAMLDSDFVCARWQAHRQNRLDDRAFLWSASVAAAALPSGWTAQPAPDTGRPAG